MDNGKTVSEVDVEDRHREIVRTVAVLIIDVNNTEKFVAYINFSRIVLAGTCLDDHCRVEGAFEIGFYFLDFFGFHTLSPCAVRVTQLLAWYNGESKVRGAINKTSSTASAARH